MRKLNLVFVIASMAAVLVFGGLVYFAHAYQLRRHATVLLDQAHKAEQDGNLAKTAKSLNHYLSLVERDGSVWKWYAEVMDKLYDSAPLNRRRQVLSAFEQALRFTPEDSKLERRCAEVAMEMGLDQINDAKAHLTNLIGGLPRDGTGPEVAELHEMMGDCQARESKFLEAANDFERATRADPTRVSSFDKWARLLRNDLRARPEEADKQIETAVKTNPNSGKAYLCRFKYDRDFGKAPRESDLQKALELIPDDADVLLTAATTTLANKKLNETRAYLEKGVKLYPRREEFALALVNLELAEQHPDRAEAILRQTYEQRPLPWIAYQLARLLIQEGKIDGEDGAASYLSILRGKGLLGEVLASLLEPLIAMRQERWNDAIGEIESAQIAVRSVPTLNNQMRGQLNMMLAECYRHTNSTEQRLAALQNAVDAGGNVDGPQLALAQELARSENPGDLDRAVRILRSFAEKRPELELEIARLLLRKTLLQPKAERNWSSVDAQLARAENRLEPAMKQTGVTEGLTSIKAEALVARDQADLARKLLSEARARNPRNLRYIIALSRLAMRQGDKDSEALKILDQAEKELGPGRELTAARLLYWSEKGGDRARAEVARIAGLRTRLSQAELPSFLDQLAQAELRLGQPALARQYWNELAKLPPPNLQVLLTLFDLSLEMGDKDEASRLIEQIRDVENPQPERAGEGNQKVAHDRSKGTSWRFAKAAYLISEEASRRPKAGAESAGSVSAPEKSTELETARTLAEEIALERPRWWGAPLLQGEIALLNGQEEDAISGFLRAFELGNTRPAMVQRLISLLDKKERYDVIDRIVGRLRDQAVSSPILKYEQARSAMRNREFDRGIELARGLLADSNRYVDHLILGRFYTAAGRPKEAEAEFHRAVEQGPGVPETWLTYVGSLMQQNKPDAARAAVDAARKALPSDRSILVIAECLMLVGDVAQASTLIDKAISEKPDDPATLRFAAGLHLNRGQTKEAIKYLKKLRDPVTNITAADLAWANRTEAIATMRAGGPNARAEALHLISGNPDTPQDRLLRATLLAGDSRSGTHLEALRLLEGLDQEKKLGTDDLVLLARLYLSEERDAKKFQDVMLRVLTGGKSRNPQHLALYIGHLIDQNHLEQAARWLIELKQVEPRGLAALEMEALLLKARNHERLIASGKAPGTLALPEVRDLLIAGERQSPDLIGPIAVLLARHGFPAEAESAYKDYIARDPKRPERTLALATFLAGQKGRAADALKVLAAAWETCPRDQVAAAALSLYDAPSVTEDQRKQVETWLTEASRKQPDLVALANKLGAIWIRQGKVDEAEAKYRQILGSNPDDPEAKNNLAWLLALRDSAKVDEAERLIGEAIGLLGRSSSLLDTKAVVLIRSGRIPEAVEALNTAGEIDPNNASVPLHLAWARREEGNLVEARKAFHRAVQLGWTPDRSDPLERSYIEKVRGDLGL
jgi:tetratricopeptide (TPR) repeat protein